MIKDMQSSSAVCACSSITDTMAMECRRVTHKCRIMRSWLSPVNAKKKKVNLLKANKDEWIKTEKEKKTVAGVDGFLVLTR